MNYCLFQAFLVYGFYMQASSFLLYGYANMAIGLELKVQNVMRSARSLNFISTVLEGKRPHLTFEFKSMLRWEFWLQLLTEDLNIIKQQLHLFSDNLNSNEFLMNERNSTFVIANLSIFFWPVGRQGSNFGQCIFYNHIHIKVWRKLCEIFSHKFKPV